MLSIEVGYTADTKDENTKEEWESDVEFLALGSLGRSCSIVVRGFVGDSEVRTSQAKSLTINRVHRIDPERDILQAFSLQPIVLDLPQIETHRSIDCGR